MCNRFVDYRSFLSIIARFRLALYVYEYLLHVGAQKAAQTFLSEVSILKCILKYIRNNSAISC